MAVAFSFQASFDTQQVADGAAKGETALDGFAGSADRAAAAETRLAAGSAQMAAAVARATSSAASEYRQLAAALDPAIAKEHQLARAKEVLARASAVGAVSQQEQIRLLRLAEAQYGATAQKVGLLGGAFGSMLKFSAGAAVIGGGVSIFRGIISESIEAEQSLSQVRAALASTGGVSGQTVESLNDIASALERTSTFGDDSVLAMESVLLTFTNVSGSTFPRAAQAVVDLATRMGGDLQGAAVQLGKALQEPDQALTALSRSGIQFNTVQEETIKKMVKAGDVAGAQAIILGEVERQFGGSAKAARETLGGSLDAIANSWGNLLEAIGRSGLGDAIASQVNAGASVLTSFTGKIESTGESLRVISTFIDAYGESMRNYAPSLLNFGENFKRALGDAAEAVRQISAEQGKEAASRDLVTKARAEFAKNWDAAVVAQAAKEKAASDARDAAAKKAKAAAESLAKALASESSARALSIANLTREIAGIGASAKERLALKIATEQQVAAEKLGLATGDKRMESINAQIAAEQTLAAEKDQAVARYEKAVDGMRDALASLAAADEAAAARQQEAQRRRSSAIASVLSDLGELQRQARLAMQEVGLLNDPSMSPREISIELNVADQLSRIDPGTLAAVNAFFAVIGQPSLEAQIRATVTALADAQDAAQIKANLRSPLDALRDQLKQIQDLQSQGLLSVSEAETTIWRLRRRYAEDLVSQISSVTGYLADAFGGVFVEIDTLVRRIQGAQQFGANVGSMAQSMGASASAAGAMSSVASVFAIYYAVYSFGKDIAAKHNGKRYRDGVELEIRDMKESWFSAGGASFEAVSMLRKTIDEIGRSLGGAFTDLPKIQLQARADGKNVKAIVDGVVIGYFDDYRSAMEAAIKRALASSKIDSSSALIEQAVGGGFPSGGSLDSFLADLQKLKTISDLNLGDGLRQLREQVVGFDDLFDALSKMRAATPAVVQGFLDIAEAEVSAWQSARDAITGRKRTAEEELADRQRQATMWNADKALRKAELQLRRIELEEKAEQLKRRLAIDRIDTNLGGVETGVAETRIRNRTDGLRAEAQILAADASMRGAYVEAVATATDTEFQVRKAGLTAMQDVLAAQLAVIEASIAAIDAVLAALPTDISFDEIQLPDLGGSVGGGGYSGPSAADRLAEFNDQMAALRLEELPDTARQVEEIRSRFAALRATATELGQSTDELDRIEGRRLDAIRAARQQENRQFALGSGGGTDWQRQLDEIGVWFGQAIDAATASGEDMADVFDAFQGRIGDLRDTVLSSLSPTYAAAKQMRDLGASIKWAEDNAQRLGISEQQLGQIRAEQEQTFFLDMAENIARRLGDEQLLADLAQARYTLEIASMRTQIELARANHVITQTTYDYLLGILDRLPDTVPAGTTGGTGGGGYTDGSPGGNVNETYDRIQDALRRLAEFENQRPGENATARRIRELNEEFANLRSILGDTARVQAAYANALQAIITEALEPLRDLGRELAFSSVSPFTRMQQYQLAAAEYQQVAAAAQAGDWNAIERLPDVARRYLELFGGVAGTSGAGYVAAYNQVMALIAQLTGQTFPTAGSGGGGLGNGTGTGRNDTGGPRVRSAALGASQFATDARTSDVRASGVESRLESVIAELRAMKTQMAELTQTERARLADERRGASARRVA